jgi:AraC family transcriptional regulator
MSGTPETRESRYTLLREEYTSRINRVVDYIERHLGEGLSLATLAKVAGFSAFHFHRIFAAMMGENLNRFIQRVRVEKAATMLVGRSKMSITDIALECGFSNSATFARAFKEYFHMSASQWRAGGHARYRKDTQADSAAEAVNGKTGRGWGVISQRIDDVARVPQWWIRFRDRDPVLVEVKEMPSLHVAYVRYVGRYQGMGEVFEELFKKLMRWAGPRGLLLDRDARLLTVCHDNPDITNDGKLRTSACITVPVNTKVEGEVGSMKIPGGQYAVGHFRLGVEEFAQAWYAMIAGWLPESGYQPDDRFCYELYSNDGNRSSEGKTAVAICVPVRPL